MSLRMQHKLNCVNLHTDESNAIALYRLHYVYHLAKLELRNLSMLVTSSNSTSWM
jgi:hypothetical protein